MIKLKKLRLVLSLVMLSLIVSVVSVSEECYADPVEEARIYVQTSLSSEEIERLKNPASPWEELNNIVMKIYPYLDVASYQKLIKAIEAIPDGILLFDYQKIFENYKKNSVTKNFFDGFEVHFRPIWQIRFAEKLRLKKEEHILQAEEARRAEETWREEENRRAEKAWRAAEDRRKEEDRKVTEALRLETEWRTKETRLAEEAWKAKEIRLEEEAWKLEDARKKEVEWREEEVRIAKEALRLEAIWKGKATRRAAEARRAAAWMAEDRKVEEEDQARRVEELFRMTEDRGEEEDRREEAERRAEEAHKKKVAWKIEEERRAEEYCRAKKALEAERAHELAETRRAAESLRMETERRAEETLRAKDAWRMEEERRAKEERRAARSWREAEDRRAKEIYRAKKAHKIDELAAQILFQLPLATSPDGTKYFQLLREAKTYEQALVACSYSNDYHEQGGIKWILLSAIDMYKGIEKTEGKRFGVKGDEFWDGFEKFLRQQQLGQRQPHEFQSQLTAKLLPLILY
ncbi:MAG: hypothetical protein LBS28_04170 [Streptococcaceae bacterium]|nr:hypothetical protein [Streptococcaceae bacterium]